jgi:hypothetical protein
MALELTSRWISEVLSKIVSFNFGCFDPTDCASLR